jgi:hypothetical protein
MEQLEAGGFAQVSGMRIKRILRNLPTEAVAVVAQVQPQGLG